MAEAALDSWRLDNYQPCHAIRADLLCRLGRSAEAIVLYDAGIALTANTAERSFLELRRNSILPDTS